MSDQIHIEYSGAFNLDHLKKGKHTFLLPFGDDEAKLVGQIIAYWGVFELRMDALITTVIQGMKYPVPKDWKRLNFVKRKALFKDVMRDYTEKMFPSLTQEFEQIADSAGDLHWRRNIIAHGFYELIPGDNLGEDDTYSAKFIATGRVKGKRRSIPIETATLQKIWHDIAHLTGELLVLVNVMGGKVSSYDLVIPDTDLLQDQKSGSFRILAISDKS